jgi:aminomethyltransferase
MLALKTSPFHARTSALMQGNQWRRWAGHTMASAYELTSDRETMAIRHSAALIDISPLFKYEVRGPDARAFLDRLVTRDLRPMAPGQVMYTPWCDGQGKVVDDGTLFMIDEASFRLTAAESNWRWLGDNALGFDLTLHDVSDALGALSLQGPFSRALLESVTGVSLSGLGYHRHTEVTLGGATIGLSRTGYTGDLGYELWVGRAQALAVWDALIDGGRSFGLQPTGMWAMDVSRIEAGLIMLDVDYTPSPRAFTEAQRSSPYELGLGWAVELDKGPFVGRKALREEKQRGPSHRLVGLVIDHLAFERAHAALGLTTPLPFIPWREIVPLHRAGEQVGYASSGTWSPLLKKYLALAQVVPSAAGLGERLTIDLMVDRRRLPFEAEVVKLPFFNPERKRA